MHCLRCTLIELISLSWLQIKLLQAIQKLVTVWLCSVQGRDLISFWLPRFSEIRLFYYLFFCPYPNASLIALKGVIDGMPGTTTSLLLNRTRHTI
jgi:hypothetical protein